ncbi:hypothetical protein [Tardiphaga sp.]|uniref:hypothetical protein n=1 Tax=Tardiphaga sp. TaxID=1926292 RepID=UPI00352ABD80
MSEVGDMGSVLARHGRAPLVALKGSVQAALVSIANKPDAHVTKVPKELVLPQPVK